MNDLLNRVSAVLTAALPSGTRVREHTADWSPTPNLVTYRASLQGATTGTNSRLGFVTLDVDVWASGPDTGAANSLADLVEASLEETTIGPPEGDLNVPGLTLRSRTIVDGDDPRLAHVTMVLSGRAYRRH